MPVFVHFYRISPAEFYGLTVPEFNALADHMEEYARETEKASRG